MNQVSVVNSRCIVLNREFVPQANIRGPVAKVSSDMNTEWPGSDSGAPICTQSEHYENA